MYTIQCDAGGGGGGGDGIFTSVCVKKVIVVNHLLEYYWCYMLIFEFFKWLMNKEIGSQGKELYSPMSSCL